MDWKASIKDVKMLDLIRFSTFQRTPSIILGEFRLYAIITSESGKAKDIKDKLNWSNEKYAPYRDRLLKKMIIDGSEYGYLKPVLPLMDDFVRIRME